MEIYRVLYKFGTDWLWELNLSFQGGLNTDAGMSERASQ